MKDLTIDEMIVRAGWFKGSMQAWERLSHEERKNRAFAGCGCEVAYPTWEGPVECVHTGCQVRRKEIKPLIQTNRILRGEIAGGWLRFGKESREGRQRLARLVRAIRKAALETGIYDPWKLPGGWQGIVGTSIS